MGQKSTQRLASTNKQKISYVVIIKAFGTNDFILNADNVKSVEEVKDIIERETGIPCKNQILFDNYDRVLLSSDEIFRPSELEVSISVIAYFHDDLDYRFKDACQKFGIKYFGPLKIRSLTMEESLPNIHKVKTVNHKMFCG